MAGLVLKMGPKERVLINGAVLENGARRARFSIVTPSANILRLKDAIHPDDADTPVGRICFQLQLILSGTRSHDDVVRQLLPQIAELAAILNDPFSQRHLAKARTALIDGKVYNALKSLKPLLPLERDLLARPVSARD